MENKKLGTFATIALIALAGLLYFQLEGEMANPLETAQTLPSATESKKSLSQDLHRLSPTQHARFMMT